MDLIGGEVSGKLYCPNSKCKSKVGTYDWTGVKDGHLNQYVSFLDKFFPPLLINEGHASNNVTSE